MQMAFVVYLLKDVHPEPVLSEHILQQSRLDF